MNILYQNTSILWKTTKLHAVVFKLGSHFSNPTMFWNLSRGLMFCNSKRGECKQHNYHFYLHFHMQLHLYLYLCFISKRRGNASKTICIYICICIGICIFICFAFLKEGGMQAKQFAPAPHYPQQSAFNLSQRML